MSLDEAWAKFTSSWAKPNEYTPKEILLLRTGFLAGYQANINAGVRSHQKYSKGVRCV